MTTLLICILGIIFVISTAIIIYKSDDSLAWSILPAICGGLMTAAIFGVIIFGITWWGTPKTNYKHYVTHLYGLSNGSQVHGSFTLGTGTVDGKEYVYYNAKAENGYIKTFRKEMSKCNFVFNDKKTYLERIHHSHIPRISGLYKDDFEPFEYCDEYVFHLRKEDANMTNYYDISNY